MIYEIRLKSAYLYIYNNNKEYYNDNMMTSKYNYFFCLNVK